MAALITRNRYALNILLNGSINNLLDRPVMAYMDDFNTRVLKYPSHDVDGCVMTIKKGCRGHDPNIVIRLINFNFTAHAPSPF